MKTHGGLHQHRGLIALTGTFLAALALSGCGNEKPIDPQAGHVSLAGEQTEITLRKKGPLPAERHPVISASRPEAEPVMRQAAQPVQIVQSVPMNNLTFSAHLPVSLKTPAALPSQPAAPAAPAVMSYSLQCDITDIANPLREVVTALEEKSLLYATGPLTDCSGIFHRVMLGLKHRCPAKDFPSVDGYRDSRALARWYHERGKLRLIRNAEESTDLLKPGAVLFFGRNGSEYRNFSVDDLLIPQKGIAHLGVVVKVHKNESGQVLHYELFHGHGSKGKTPASVTDWHKRTPTRSGYPPFGNGRQQWVAVARL